MVCEALLVYSCVPAVNIHELLHGVIARLADASKGSS